MIDRTKVWINYAEKDWEVVESIKDNVRLDSMIAFHGQQMTEKYLKAILEENCIPFQKTHHLAKLYDLLPESITDNLKVSEEYLDILDTVYIDTRYPADIGLLPHGEMSEQERVKFLAIIFEIHIIFVKYLESI
jgi:HEPN domain-containing protein